MKLAWRNAWVRYYWAKCVRITQNAWDWVSLVFRTKSNGCRPLTNFAKSSVLDVRLGFEYASDSNDPEAYQIKWDDLRNLSFEQFKKREKHPWWSVNFTKKILVNGCLSRFLCCTNGTKSGNTSHMSKTKKSLTASIYFNNTGKFEIKQAD